jgi:type IV pilus assembly protein PilQ
MTSKRIIAIALAAVLFQLIFTLLSPVDVQAQDRPSQRQLRTYVPPDQLVSFLPSTPFSVFVDFMNPIFERVTGRAIVDPTSAEYPIGISIGGMHFMDAFELVLDYHGLTYRETDRYFVIEEAPEMNAIADAGEARAGTSRQGAAASVAPASVMTREIQINAILFELNVTRARELGVDWNVFFGEQTGGSGGGSGGGTGGGGSSAGQQGAPRFQLKTKDFFDEFSDIIEGPDEIELSTLTRFFRLMENEGIGETIANPQVTVQSGEQGRIQIGSDIPVQIRDFSGNTVTQFFSTGIIVDVVPTLITQATDDSLNAPELDFIHLNVKVEKSAGRPTLSGIVIDRNDATTQVLLLDREQTVIGGLYSTEESVSRRGIPVLKDLPWWFFGLRYIFGVEQTTVSQKELLIVLQADVLDSLEDRAANPIRGGDELRERRDKIQDVLRRTGFEKQADEVMPNMQ